MNGTHPKIRIAAAIAGALLVALLTVTVASAKGPKPPKPPKPPKAHGTHVPCAGQAALVAAIDAANTAGGGKLTLAPHCDYQLTSADNGENGLPVITTKITIKGRHATIDGTGTVRVFEVDGPGGALSLSQLTLTGGSADFGGGIANMGGSVLLDHTRVSHNVATMAGGGIASATVDPSSTARLTLRHSSVNGNQQTLPPSQDQSGGLGGGGIVNVDGVAKLDHSKVDGNTAQAFVGGGIASGDYFNFSSTDSVLIVRHSQVNGNSAPNAGGGGIQNLLGSATIDHSRVNGNTSLNGSGISSGSAGAPDLTAHLVVKHSQVNGNTATAGPGGEGPPLAAGGIANGSDAVIVHSKVDHNTASHGLGGGIVNHGTMAVTHSEVNRNTATASGFAGSGGGIFNVTPPESATAALTLDHSRVIGNTAGGFGGGIANGAGPLSGGDVTATHSHVMHNTAAHGGGIFNNTGGTVTLSDTQVTHNQVDNCEPTDTITGCTN